MPTTTTWRRLTHDERVSGGLLLVAALAALGLANSPASEGYHRLLQTRFGPQSVHLDLPVAAWATEGLLTVFFFVVGVELAREFRVGALRDARHAALPVVAAAGGMIVPGLVYVAILLIGRHNAGLGGWAIPTATDIGFALAILSVAGRGLSGGVRTFLLTLAVVDDLIGIVVIAIFYTEQIKIFPLVVALAGIALFRTLVRLPRVGWWPLVLIAIVTWSAMHDSGIQPAITGAALGLAVPVMPLKGEKIGRAGRYEDFWRPWASWFAMPVFAFSAAGVSLAQGASDAVLVSAIIAGLIIGKPVGVVGAALLATRLGGLILPRGVEEADLLPIGMLTGIGFTVALLIGRLSFDDPILTDAGTVGVLLGSAIACIGAALLLRIRVHQIRASKT